ncbi:MAG TPA: TPM domain-containing protein [Allosphingosinicella sp.]|nr:TPM domain-containing protein [Allosphingosinicella sp.]
MRLLRPLLLLLVLAAAPAAAQTFPALTGRVVDAANIIPDADEAALTGRLSALQQASSRQLVVATVPDLQGYPIEDYGYQLGRHWGIGQKGANNGIILLVAPNERKVRIEVGYGLEPIMTDALSSQIIADQILPAFKKGDFPGGINAGADAIIAQLQAPPEQAEQKALEAQQASSRGMDEEAIGNLLPLAFWGIVFVFVIIPMIARGGRRGRRYRRRGVWVWGPGLGGGWGGGSSGGGGWGSGGGGFGGFSGGGGSFGGGGASGGW